MSGEGPSRIKDSSTPLPSAVVVLVAHVVGEDAGPGADLVAGGHGEEVDADGKGEDAVVVAPLGGPPGTPI